MYLDFVSIVAVECRDGLMGHGGVFLSWVASSQVIGVILWVGGILSVCTYLKCPTKEGFQSRALSRGD